MSEAKTKTLRGVFVIEGESIRKCVEEPRIFNMRDRVTNIWEMKKINEQEENQTDRNGCKKPKEKESHWFELSN